MNRSIIAVLAGTTLVALPAASQTVAERVEAVVDGTIRLSYAARPGVCGNGENISTRNPTRTGDWEWECDPGPVRVAVVKVGGRIEEIRTYVGGRWLPPRADATDLGTVAPDVAAAFLLEVVRRRDDRVARRAMSAATLANGVITWPVLLEVAKDDGRSRRLRRSALQHVGMAAGDLVRARMGPSQLDESDRRMREQAVFSASQLPRDIGLPLLIDVAQTHRDGEIRRRALFWLGQTGDARAIPVLESVLRPQ